MENKNFEKVYCRGTINGIGVKEALEARGGVVKHPFLHFNQSDAVFFISPLDGSIEVIDITSSYFYHIIKPLFTEIMPLLPPKPQYINGRWRAYYGGDYYHILILGGWAVTKECRDDYDCIDDTRFEKGNYYRTEEEAQRDAEAMNKILTKNAKNVRKKR